MSDRETRARSAVSARAGPDTSDGFLDYSQHQVFRHAVDGIGFSIWGLGFIVEAISDAQLASFAKNPRNRGRILQSGMWRYSRHPNYFGEIVQWWGIWVVALGTAGGWFGVIGPLKITILIVRSRNPGRSLNAPGRRFHAHTYPP